MLVGVDLGEYDCEASLDELEELAKTAGAEVEARVTQRRETPDSATFIGSGRLREIKTSAPTTTLICLSSTAS